MTGKVLSRQQIIGLVAEGKAIIIYKKNVLNLTSWLKYHPGGETAVYHMIGRDASDEMHAYHGEETISTFLKWKIGEIDYQWTNLLPPIQGADYTRSEYITSLDSKLDDSSRSSSDLDLNSQSSASTILDSFLVPEAGLGYPKGKVVPVVPQNQLVTKDNSDKIFKPNKRVGKVVDPKTLLDNYDNDQSLKDLNEIPSLDYETQRVLRDKYDTLHKKVVDLGLYQCDYWNYIRELMKISSLFLLSFSFLKWNYLFVSAVLMGFAWHQMTFIAHDAGHISITHNYQVDNIFGILIANWFGGLSLGWWKRNHNVHHIITNDPVHDPDIQHLPFFAVSVRLFRNVYSTYYKKQLPFDAATQFLIPYQKYLYYPILCFGRFNLYRLSWEYLLKGNGPRHGKAAWFRYFEIVGLTWFFFWFFYLLVTKSIDGGWNRFNYIIVSHVTTMMVHVQITLSHFAMSTADLGVSESFASRQLRTTMDVDCPEWLDFFHGGLQFQAIHHLFPRMPKHNLRKAQPYVIDFCKDVGLNYSIYGFGDGNGAVIDKLGEIGKQCSIMLDAAKKYDGDLY